MLGSFYVSQYRNNEATNGAPLALHKHGAIGGFVVEDDQIDTTLETKIFYVGGVGRMDRIDNGCTVEVMPEAKARG